MKQIPEGYYPTNFGLYNAVIDQPCSICGEWTKELHQFRHESEDDYKNPSIYVCHKDKMEWFETQEVKAVGFE